MKIEINLLPQNKKEEIRKSKQFQSILGWEVVISFIAVIFFGFIFVLNHLIDLNFKVVSAENNGSDGNKYETIKYYENKFSEINSKISKISDVSKGQIYWSEFFLKLNGAVPDSVEITDLSTKNFSAYLAGKAKTREDLLRFQDNLNKIECFENVNLPLSNLVSKEDVAFQMDLEIKEQCIKNK